MSSSNPIARFSHGESGMTRFPPNVESVLVQHDTTVSWLIVRRNDTELRLPLYDEDRLFLARRLLEGSGFSVKED